MDEPAPADAGDGGDAGAPPAPTQHQHRCALCPEGRPPLSAGNLGELVGPVHAGSGAYESCWVHRTCAEWSPEVYWEDEQLRNVAAAIKRGRRMACAHCGGKGATLGCLVAACNRSYHYACARAGNAQVRCGVHACCARTLTHSAALHA
jgi:hypothetical protein